MILDEMVVRSHPGEGLVARFPGVALVMVPNSPSHDAVVNHLLALAEAASANGPTPGRRLARQVAGVLSSAEPEDVPPFGLLAEADTGVVLILHGSMDTEVSWPQGKEHLSGGLVATWVDRILPPPIIELIMAPTGPAPAPPDPRSRLVSGVVAGSGLTLVPSGAAASPREPVAAAAPPFSAAPAPPPTPFPIPEPAVADPSGAWPATEFQAAPPPWPAAEPRVAPAPWPAAEPQVAPAPWPAAQPQVAPAPWPAAEPVVAPEPYPEPAVVAPPPPIPEPAVDAAPPPIPEPAVADPAPWAAPPVVADYVAEPAPAPNVQLPPVAANQDEPPTVLAEAAAPPAVAGEEPAPEPAEPQPFVAVALAEPEPEPAEVRQPLPIAGQAPAAYEEPPGPRVRGVICSRGHFNDPSAPFCGVCGISMVQRTLNLVEGPRPPLGVIVFDDGTTFTLDSDYVLGREPENDPAVLSGSARALAMADPDRTVSRVHAGLILDGWNVKAIDRGSANGTFLATPGDDSWVALIPNKPTAIKPGTRIRLGQRVLLFDSHQGTR
jgi:hypothetical protein